MNFERKQHVPFTFWEPINGHSRPRRGGEKIWGESVKQVSYLQPNEQAMLDYERLAMLYAQLGEAAADAVISRAMEELAMRLEFAERTYRQNNLKDLRKCANAMITVADQIGMCTLGFVAQAVVQCVGDDDSTALAAVVNRLIRIGANSLSEIWEQQGLSI
jgi:hypothetical protein